MMEHATVLEGCKWSDLVRGWDEAGEMGRAQDFFQS